MFFQSHRNHGFISFFWLQAVFIFFLLAAAPAVFSLPTGERISVGQGVISRPDVNQFHVKQQSSKLSINYQSFNIAAHEKVVFDQPGKDAIVLNRVLGGNASQIFGQIQANGQVFLLNPQGIVFSASSQLNVGSLMASTLPLSDQDFIAGHYEMGAAFEGSEIINNGTITAAKEGYIALIAPVLVNNGEIVADQGQITLHSAEHVLLTFDDGLHILTEKSALKGSIKNSGSLIANGGLIRLDAVTRDGLRQTAVNNDGLIQAKGIMQKNGRIFLTANEGDVINQGEINVSAIGGDSGGGEILIKANRIAQAGNIQANASGVGNGGMVNVLAEETLLIDGGSQAMANGGQQGDGGELGFYAAGKTLFEEHALITAKGGGISGDGGFVEVSGLERVWVQGQVDTSATLGNVGLFYIDPNNIDIVAVVGTANGSFSAGVWVPTGGGSSNIDTALITSLLQSSDVTIDTSTTAVPGPDAGQIGTLTVSADIDLDGASTLSGGITTTLTLRSDSQLQVLANICDLNGGASCVGSDSAHIVIDTQTANSAGNIVINTGLELNASGGNISLLSDNGLTIGSGANIDSGGGDIIMSNFGKIDIGDTVIVDSGGGAITVATGSDGFAAADDIILRNGSSFNSAGGLISFQANAGGVLVFSGTSNFDAGSGDLSIVANSVDLQESSFSNVNNLTVTSLGGANTIIIPDAGLTAAGKIELLAAEVRDVSGHTLSFSSTDLVFSTTAQTAATNMSLAVTNLDLRVGGLGPILVTDTDGLGLNLVDLNADGRALFIGDVDVSISSSSSFLTLSDSADLDNGVANQLTLIGSTDLNFNADISNTLSTSNISLSSGSGDINLSATASINSNGGNITAIADQNIVMADGATMAAGTGTLNLNANTDAIITGLISSKVDVANIITVTAGGQIIDAGDTNLDIDGASGRISLMAANGIGDDGTTVNGLEIDANNGSFSNTVSNDIYVLESNNIIVDIVNSIATFDLDALGDIDFSSTSITAVTGLNLDAAGTITLADSGLNIGLGNFNILNLQGNDIVDISGRELDITAGFLSFRSASAGGNTLVNTTVDDLIIINNGVNTLAFVETDSLDLNGISMTNGSVSVSAANGLNIPNFLGIILNGDGTSALSLVAGDTLSINDNINDAGSGTAINLASTLGDVIVDSGAIVESAGGDIDIQSIAGNIAINDGQLLSSGGNIDLTANNTGTAISVGESSTVNSGTGDLTLTAYQILAHNLRSSSTSNTAISLNSLTDIQDNGIGLDVIASNGRVVLNAVSGINDSGGTQSLDIRAQEITVTNSGMGLVKLDLENTSTTFIDVNVADDFTLLTASAGQNIIIQNITAWGDDVAITAAGDIVLPDGMLSVVSSLTLDANDIYDTDRTLNFSVPVLDLTTATAAGDSVVNINSADLLVNHLGSNLLDIREANTLNLQSLSLSTGDLYLRANVLNVTTPIDLDGAIGSELRLSTTADFTLSVDIADSTGTVDNDTFINLIADLGTDLNIAEGVTVNAGAGKIALSGNVVQLGGLISTNSAADAVSVIASNNIIDRNGTDISAINGGVVLMAANGITGGGIEQTLDIATAQLSVTNSVSGDIIIANNGDLQINLVNMAGGDTTISSINGGDITVFNAIDLDAQLSASTLTLNAAGNLNLNANICEGGASCVVLDDAVELILNAAGHINVIAGTQIYSGGSNIALDATAGNITVFDTALIHSGIGTLSLSAGGSATVTGLISAASVNNAISVTSVGNISDAGDTRLDIQAINGGLLLFTQSGNITDLETQVDSLTLSVLNSGNISINEVDDLILNPSLIPNNIDLQVAGLLTLPDAGLSTPGNITLAVNDIDAVSGRLINLNANILNLSISTSTQDVIIDSAINQLNLINASAGIIRLSDSDDVDILNLTTTGSNIDVLSLGDMSIINDLDLDGGNGARLLLSSGGQFIVNDGITIFDSNTATVDAIDLTFSSNGAMTLADNSQINSYGGNVILQSANFNINTNAVLNAGSGLLSVSGTVITLAGKLISSNTSNNAIEIRSTANIVGDADLDNVAEIEAKSGGVVLTAATGIDVDIDSPLLQITNTTTGLVNIDALSTLDITAMTLLDSDVFIRSLSGDISLSAPIDLNNNAAKSWQFNAANDLFILANICEGGGTCSAVDDSVNLDFSASGDIQVASTVSLASGGGDMVFATTGGDIMFALDSSINSGLGDINLNTASLLQLPDSGLIALGNVFIDAADIYDADRAILIRADQLTMNITASAADLTINSQVNQADIFMGAKSLLLTQSQALDFVDLNNDGNAITVIDGDFNAVIDGELQVLNAIAVADISADGIRKGGLFLSATGNVTVLANLFSSNTVDQNISGGATGILIENTRTDQVVHLILGDGVGDDVLITAEGGDIVFDWFANTTATADSQSSIILNSDVLIQAVDSGMNDGLGEVLISENAVNNGASLLANSGRSILIDGFFAEPDVIPPDDIIDPEDIIEEISEIIAEEVRDKSAIEEISEIIAEEVRDKSAIDDEVVVMQEVDSDTDFNQVTGNFFTACTRKGSDRENACELEQAMTSFLGALLIGGQLPDI